MTLRNLISSVLSLPLSEINEIIDKKCNNSYYIYKIEKKNSNGKRKIFHPSKKIKSIQYLLTNLIFNKIRIHDNAMAYVKGKKNPLRKNALKHSKFRYNIKVDFKNF